MNYFGKDVVFLFTVEGFGDAFAPYEQTRFCTRVPANGGAAYENCILEHPQALDLNLNFDTMQVTVSGLQFNLRCTERVLDCFQCDDPPSPLQWADPALEVSESDTTFYLTNDVPIGKWAGQVIQWDREDIRIGNSTFVSGEYENCVRGMYGTTASPHNQTDVNLGIVPDREMFLVDTNKIREDRIVKMYVVDFDDPDPMANERLVWSGVLSSNPRYQGLQLTVYSDNVLKVLGLKTICNDLLRFRADFDIIRFEDTEGYSPTNFTSVIPRYPVSRQGSDLAGNMLISLDGKYGCQVAWFTLTDNGVPSSIIFSLAPTRAGIEVDGYPGVVYFEPWPVPAPPYELSKKLKDAWEFYTTDTRIRPAEGPALSQNRFTLCLQILLTGGVGTAAGPYNLGVEDLGCALQVDQVDVEEFEAFAALYSDAPLDSLHLGLDGKPIQVLDFLQNEILGPVGCQLIPGPDGRLRPARLGDAPDLSNFPTITPSDMVGQPEEVTVDYGSDELPVQFDHAPGLEPIIDRFTNGTRLRRRLRRRTAHTMQLPSTRDRELVADIAINWIDRRRTKMREVYWTGMPENEPKLWPGQVFKLTHPLIMKPRWEPGTPLQERFGVVDAVFLCLSRTERWGEGYTDYKALFVGAIYDRTGYFAPSGRAASYAAGQLVLEPPGLDPFSNLTGFVSGELNQNDTAGFAIGDVIQVWSVGFSKITTGTITAIDVGTRTLDVDLGGYSVTTGDVITLADYTQNATASEIYAFLADDSSPPNVNGDIPYEYTS